MCDLGIHLVVSLQIESSLGEYFYTMTKFYSYSFKKAWGAPTGPCRFNGEKSTWSCSYFLDLSHNTQILQELHVWKFALFSQVQLQKVCFLLFFCYI